jgi:nitrogen regulatory protein PII
LPDQARKLTETMKKIEAIIRPFKMEDVRAALIEMGIEGVTVTEVKVSDRRRGQTNITPSDYAVEFLPKLKFEIVVVDNHVRRTVEAILRKARTGKIGDGKVFIAPIQDVIRIRTGERGEAAV